MVKVCLITGASSGLGEMFLKHSINLIDADEYWIISRSKDKLDAMASKYNAKIKSVPVDLINESAISEIENLLTQENAQITALINNAGFGKIGKVWEIPYYEQQQMICLNCSALTALCSVCIKFMKENSFILNVGSIAAFSPNANLNCYSATKSYVFAFTNGLRFELKNKKINACVCCPGPMQTPFLANANINKGSSHAFDTLPYCNPDKVARKSIIAAKKGRAVYTPTFFYKFYRILAKLIPVKIMMYLSKV